MKESHEKTLILAVCENESIYCFGTFSESMVGDDILGNYTIGSEIGNYCFTTEKAECNGFVSVTPDSVSLQSYLKGEPNEEFDAFCQTVGIKSKIKEFYWLNTDICCDDNYMLFSKVTTEKIESLNDDNQIYTVIPNKILRMLLLEIAK